MPPKLSEVWDPVGDWTGVTSATERRKRQNRLHQRAYRESRPVSNGLGRSMLTCGTERQTETPERVFFQRP
ncbi:hypothetical protein CEP53_005237 [Fusarium sp. AF-6]|nr:hypothetical protein CEP53_005237 [Fusarium sp. AF-6]